MALDGLGLVYEKQGNTGAAAYNQPVLEIGKNPLDLLASNLIAQGQEDYTRKQKEKQAKDLANQEALQFDVDAWDYDNQAFINGSVEALMGEGARLKSLGKDLNNLNDPDVKNWQFAKARLKKVGEASQGQGKQLESYLKEAAENPDKYDYGQTVQKFKEFQQMKPTERIGVEMSSILVPKQKPLDMFQLVNDMPLDDYYNKTSFKNEKMSSSKTKARLADIEQSIVANANNPTYQAIYEDGLSKNLWTNKQEYIKVQTDEAKRRLKEEKEFVKKAPKEDFDFNTFNSLGADEALGKIGFGNQKIQIPTDGGKGEVVDYKYVTQLGDFNATVANESLIVASTGKPLTGTGTKALKSGAMVIAPVYKGTNRPYPLKKGETEEDAVRSGKAEMGVLIFGKAEEDNGSSKTTKDVFTDARSAIESTGESKVLTKGKAAYIAQKKKANELQERYTKKKEPTETKAKASPKSYSQKYKDSKGEFVYTNDGVTFWYANGKQYTE